MSESTVSDALVRLLQERPDDWRSLADLAVDFAPPHIARATVQAMSDPAADPSAVLEAIGAVSEPVFDDTPLLIGSVEPESLDFAPVSTLTTDPAAPSADFDLDFGAGTFESGDGFDPMYPTFEGDEFDEDLASMEVDHGMTPEPADLIEDEPMIDLDDDLDDDDFEEEDGDDGDLLDVGD